MTKQELDAAIAIGEEAVEYMRGHQHNEDDAVTLRVKEEKE